MNVAFTPRAQAALDRMAARWRTHARNPQVFLDEVTEIVQRLSSSAETGVVAQRTERRTIYRMGAERTKLHFYYRIDGAQVVVLQVWSQFRQRPPRL